MSDTSSGDGGERTLIILVGVLLSACLAVWAAGQLAGWVWGDRWPDVPVTESPRLLWKLAQQPAIPASAWPQSTAPHFPGPLGFYTTLSLIIAAPTALGGWGWHLHKRRQISKEPESARWATPKDLKPLLVPRPRPGRLTLGTVKGRMVATEQQHSVAVIGPSGTGKTTGFAIPALLEWDGPVIATTVKGDLLAPTIAARQSGGEVWVYDPTAATGLDSAGWSPLDGSADWQGALRMAAWLVSTARAGERGGLQDSDFWYAVAQKLLAPLLHAAALSGASMRDVVRWVDLQDEEEPLRALQRTGETDPIQAFAASINREERTRSSAYTTTETVLAAFADPGVLHTANAANRITPGRLLDGGSHTLYVCGPLHEQARLRPLFTALVEEMVAAVYQRAAHRDSHIRRPLLLVLDEAANIAPLPDLAQLASTARGVGIQLVTVWQDFAQIQARYGAFAPTVINNHRAKVVLAGVSDTPTLDYLSRLVGDQATTETTRHKQGNGKTTSTTEAVRHRPLATAAALRRTQTGTGILIYGNLHPALIHLRRARRMRGAETRSAARSRPPTTVEIPVLDTGRGRRPTFEQARVRY